MKISKIKLSFAIVFCFIAALNAFAQNDKNTSAEAKKAIEVQKFEIKQGVEFPAASVDVMMAEIVDELKKLNTFGQVSMDMPAKDGAAPTTPVQKTEPNFVLNGTITKYEPGNRAARYVGGMFGAGKTKIVALIKVIDKATGKVVIEKSVDGKVIIGVFGGDSNGATRGLAKEVASTIKKSVK